MLSTIISYMGIISINDPLKCIDEMAKKFVRGRGITDRSGDVTFPVACCNFSVARSRSRIKSHSNGAEGKERGCRLPPRHSAETSLYKFTE